VVTGVRDPRYDILFTPVKIGPKVLRNRFYHTPQCSGFGSDRPGAQAYHRGLKAEGGFAIVHTEWCGFSPETDQWPMVTSRIWDDDDARNLSLMCDKVHEHGALAGIQLAYNGAETDNLESRMASRGVSAIPNDMASAVPPYEMDLDDILGLQRQYVAAARRALDAGFDVIQICADEDAGIPQQFLMKQHNKRTDGYGGSLANRTRFLVEVLELVRAEVGEYCAVTARLCIDTGHTDDQGIRVDEEGLAVVQMVDHLVDLWDIQVGARTSSEWGEDAGSSRFFKEGFQLAAASKVKSVTDKPVVNVGRWVHPDRMAQVINSGAIDLIGMARPSIADPFLPAKIAEGREDEIRECIGCNICVSRYQQAATIVCTQNSTIGEEYRRGWHPELIPAARDTDRAVLVVGAGPAGLECATVMGRRGLNVHLVDAGDEPGGHLRWVSRLPGMSEWAWVIDHRKVLLDKLPNVEFIGHRALTAQDVRDYGADIAVIATGSSWSRDGSSGVTFGPLPGAAGLGGFVMTPEDIGRDGLRPGGKRVAVYDCEGFFAAAATAELLTREGYQVTYVTPHSDAAPYTFNTLEGARMNRHLRWLGIRVVTHHMFTSVQPGRVLGAHIYDGGDPVAFDVDAVVLCTMRVANDALYRELKDARLTDLELYRIGDCHSPRIIADVIFDGHRLAREIDEEDPATPLPFIRERRVLGKSDLSFDSLLAGRSAARQVESQPSRRLLPEGDSR
jgi:dimethylamine/trimethylamine dehydrogenase